MKQAENLSQLEIGQAALIDSICTQDPMRRRLLDMGFTSGTQVQCLYKSPSGDPAAYMVRHAVVALRNEDARCVFAVPVKQRDECACKRFAPIKMN